MADKQSVFHFELNESLYFQSGQEVSDIIGASLDPEIAIQAFQDYISIRGVIELTGDYHKADMMNPLDEPPFDANEVHEKNFMGKVMNKSDSAAIFTHRFPVEISVPSHRVSDMEEITVQVTSFDYEIPNHHQMNVLASIKIGGITEEVEEPEKFTSENPSVEEDTDPKSNTEKDDIPFDNQTEPEEPEADILPEENQEVTEENDLTEEKTEDSFEVPAVEENQETTDNISPSEEAQEETPLPEEKNETDPEMGEENKGGQKKKKKTQTLEDFINKDEPKNTGNQDVPQEVVEGENTSDETEVTDENDGVIKTNETIRESDQDDTPIMSLSKIFGSNHEDEYAKMRLCIVQVSDTIATIAERYETTSNQIMLQNHLTDESITEGQILSIPEKARK